MTKVRAYESDGRLTNQLGQGASGLSDGLRPLDGDLPNHQIIFSRGVFRAHLANQTIIMVRHNEPPRSVGEAPLRSSLHLKADRLRQRKIRNRYLFGFRKGLRSPHSGSPSSSDRNKSIECSEPCSSSQRSGSSNPALRPPPCSSPLTNPTVSSASSTRTPMRKNSGL
jgi:hypothetical protein